ncbi:MAG: SGNH/GDSL hydrolase family protein [Eubacteriales bacterium]|nr:SGNH/GDSL hydrolase family protein [Eubacteriales bacterium]
MLNAEILNQAIGGYWFEGASLDDELKSLKPDLITVAYGTNDYSLSETLEIFINGARGFMDRLTEIFPDTPVLAIMPIWRADRKFHDRSRMLDYSSTDAFAALREMYAGYSNVTVLEDTYFPTSPDFLNSEDRLHPNDLGFTFYADAVTDASKKLLNIVY